MYHPVVDADGIEFESQLIFYNEQEIDLIAATHHFMMDSTSRPIQSLPFEQLFIISAVIETENKSRRHSHPGFHEPLTVWLSFR